MLNGLLTLRGAWDKVRENPVLKFLVVAVTAYGMSTFEGPMMSLKNVNAISHYTDWTIAHVHIGGLGWNGFLTFGMLYWLFPKMWRVDLHSIKLANFHFWIGTLGILFWTLPMYWTGFTQSLMWKEFTPDGFLMYPNFLETVKQLAPMYALRALGGLLYLTGFIVMLFNLFQTMKAGNFVSQEAAEAAPLEKNFAKPKNETFHRLLERKPIQMLLLSFVAVAIGGAIEIVPTFLISSNVPTISSVKPYTPLELEGRDLYIREGCNNCHSQMVRPFRSETVRYGEYSKAGEFVYDHPFLWGSKRTGPDLHRIGRGNKNSKSNVWHFNHMFDPQVVSEGSIMPPYPWLIEDELDVSTLGAKISAMRKLGVPYVEGYEEIALEELQYQAQEIADDIAANGVEVSSDREIIALIAYLQRLGTDINNAEEVPVK
jgi:cytochrome c oxidase cbb3-type subunit I/II